MAAQRGPGFQGPACSLASGWDESRSRGPRKSCVVAGEACAVPCCLPELHQCVVCRAWGLDSGSSSSCPDLPVLTEGDWPLRAGRPGEAAMKLGVQDVTPTATSTGFMWSLGWS